MHSLCLSTQFQDKFRLSFQYGHHTSRILVNDPQNEIQWNESPIDCTFVYCIWQLLKLSTRL